MLRLHWAGGSRGAGMVRWHHGLWVLLVVGIAAAPRDTSAAVARADEDVRVRAAVAEDIYLAGEQVRIDAAVQGDVVAAAEDLVVAGEVGADLIGAAETLRVEAAVADDVRLAGATIDVNAPVSGHAVAAGERVTVRGDIGDSLWAAGAEVRIEGSVGAGLRAAGEAVVIAGRVDGDAQIAGGTVRLTPEAHIAGDLIYRSETELEMADGAVIEGDIRREAAPWEEVGAPSWIPALIFWIGIAVLMLLLYALMPRLLHNSATALAARPGPVVGWGFGLLLLVPIAVAVTLLSGVGTVVGITVLFAYLTALLLGTAVGLAALTLLILSRLAAPGELNTALNMLGLVGASLLTFLIGLIPVLGGIWWFVVLVSGLGLLLQGIGRLRRLPAAE
mgnify:CR=1 FL=1